MQEQNIPCRRNKIFSTRRNIPCRSSDNFFDATRSRNKIFLSIARPRHDCFGTANHRREDSSNVERRRGGRIYLGFWIWKSSGCNRHCSISTRLLDCVGGLNFGSSKDVRWCCWTVWRRMLQVPWSSLMSLASPDRLRKIGINECRWFSKVSRSIAICRWIMSTVFSPKSYQCYEDDDATTSINIYQRFMYDGANKQGWVPALWHNARTLETIFDKRPPHKLVWRAFVDEFKTNWRFFRG